MDNIYTFNGLPATISRLPATRKIVRNLEINEPLRWKVNFLDGTQLISTFDIDEYANYKNQQTSNNTPVTNGPFITGETWAGPRAESLLSRPNEKAGKVIQETALAVGQFIELNKEGLQSLSSAGNTSNSLFAGKTFNTDVKNGLYVSTSFNNDGTISSSMKSPYEWNLSFDGPLKDSLSQSADRVFGNTSISGASTNTSSNSSWGTFGKAVGSVATNTVGKVAGAALKEGAGLIIKGAGLGAAKSAAGSAASSALKGLSSAGNIANMAVGLGSVALNAFSDKVKNQSSLTKGINTAYDVASTAVNFIPGVGLAVSLATAVNGLATDALTAAGVGTDQITTMDQIFDSKFFKLSLGLINASITKKTNDFYKNDDALYGVGSAYDYTANNITKLHEKAGKKVGAISTAIGELKDINKGIAKSSSDMLKLTSMHEENQAALAGQANPFIGIRNKMIDYGGVLGRVYSSRNGSKLYDRNTYKRVLKLKNGKKKLQEGGTINRSLKELILYAKDKNPRFVQRMSEPIRFITWIERDKDGYDVLYSGTHELSYADGKVFPMIQDINGKLVRFTNYKEALLSAILNNNYLEMTPDEAKIFTESNDNTEGYKSGWPEFFKELPSEFWDFWETLPSELQNNDTFNMYEYWKSHNKPKNFKQIKDSGLESAIELFRKGGAFNVIPDGALHKNKHHLEDIDEKFKEVTHKGIPVISEENGKIIQHAEVEKEEIILRYEVTKKIEKLMKENTDEAAIKAGELLVYEILHNTVDNTEKMI